MTDTFEAGLRDLYGYAADAHAARHRLPVAAMVTRARRRRRARTAVSAVSIAAAGGAVFGIASLLAGGGDPVLPAETPTPPAVTGSVADPTCGTALSDVRVLSHPSLTLDGALDTPTVEEGEALTGRLGLVQDGDLPPNFEATIPGGYRYLVVHDGVVVGVGESRVQEVADDGPATHTATVRPLSCGDDGSPTDRPTAAGDYDLYLVLPATLGDPPEVGVLLAGPWAFTVLDAESSAEGSPLRAPDESRSPDGVSAIPQSDAELEDGDFFGFLRGIDAEAGTVDADIAIFYHGQAAIDWLEANDPDAEIPPPNDYLIVNEVERVRTLTLSPDVRIWDWCFGDPGATHRERPLAEWAAAPDDATTECAAGPQLSRSPGSVYWFDVRDGVVVQIVGQYLP